ncbi:hypothetical protein HOLleu_42812 [Holothuria leucospilota]|uniref:AAA+ ATPase domain-containing protein n=1 Tax=Holothuria leucospilota TaxID=206669 RepID=A0A9Q1B981_HOLLE|nr:hypothetical protein HOLleu_42812 [Holothuria leucospilota]
MNPTLIHPFTCVIAGPTGCGKTQFVRKLLTQDVIEGTPDRVVYCYGEYQSAFVELSDTIDKIRFVEGLPSDLEKYLDPAYTTLIILDDIMTSHGNDQPNTDLFSKGSHHRNISVIYILQKKKKKIYGAKETRNITLNAHYIVLFKNPRDKTQFSNLGKQMYPGQVKFVQEAFADATKEPYGYLFIYLNPNTPEDFRLRTNILSHQIQYAYVPK